MASLMPSIPALSTSAPTVMFKRQKGRKYTVQELLNVPIMQLQKEELGDQLRYLKDEKGYNGSINVTSKPAGRALLIEARRITALPEDQRPQAAATIIAGLNTAKQILPEGYTVVRRVGEVPRVPDLTADNPRDTRAANRPDLVSPWTSWDGNITPGSALPSKTSEEKALVRQLKKRIGSWLEADRPSTQRLGEAGVVRSSSNAYVDTLRTMWRRGLGRNEEDLLTWNWASLQYSDAESKGRWTERHLDQLICWINKAPLSEDVMQAASRLLRQEADAELEEADEDMRPEGDGVTQQRKFTTQRSYMNALQVTFRYRNGGKVSAPAQDPSYRKTNAWVAWYNWVIFAAEGRQDRDQKELLFGKTHKELLQIVAALQKQVEQLQGWRQPPMTAVEAYTTNPLTGKDGWDTLFEWLALGAMVLQPPIRGNWGKLKCTADWVAATTLHADTGLNENFLYQKPGPNGEEFGSRSYGDRESRYIMCINVDKVSKKTGSDQIVCSQEFSDCLTTSFKMWPRAYAFALKFDGDTRQVNSRKPMGDKQQMPSYLGKIKNPILGAWDYGKKMHQGVQLLRSSYVTWFYNRGTFYGDDGPIPDHNAKKTLAKSMRHQWQQAETNYRKLPVVQQRTAVWDETIKAYRIEEGNRVIDHIGDPNLVMNPIPNDLKPTKPPEPPIYQSGAGSPLRGAVANIPVDMEWVNEYMPKKMAWDITMATRGASDRQRFQRNYQQIRARQTSDRNKAYHERNKKKIVAKCILRRIALRGTADFVSDATRVKYGIGTDAAGEYFSSLLNQRIMTEAQPSSPLSVIAEEEERVVPSEEEEDVNMPEQQQEEEEESEEGQVLREAFADAVVVTEWQKTVEREYESNNRLPLEQYLPVLLGEIDVASVREYRDKLIHLKNMINFYS